MFIYIHIIFLFLKQKVYNQSIWLIKKFPEFIQKIQNTSFIHQKWYCPLQSTPHRLQCTICQRLIQLLKHFWNFIVDIVIRAVFDFSIISFRLLKCVPRNGFLIRLNRKKSQGAISGEFDGCWMVFVLFLVKNSRIMMALCDGALSWCKFNSIFKTVKNRKYVQR